MTIGPENVTFPGEPRLIWNFENQRPVELLDFTGALMALGDQYRAHIRRMAPDYYLDDYRLYVKSVSTGSIVAEMVSLVAQGQLMPYSSFIFSFVQQLSDLFDSSRARRMLKT